MSLTRRNFMEQTLAAGVFSGVLSATDMAKVSVSLQQAGAAQAAEPLPSGLPQHDAFNFWNSYFDSVDTTHKTRGALPKVQVGDRQIEYLHYGPKGLRYLEDIDESELLDHYGDVQITAELAGCRPGNGDQAHFQRGAQFRLDCAQTRPYMNLVAPLAWSLMASLKADKAGKLPTMQALGFNAGSTSSNTKILLPSGAGKMGVNVYVTAGESFMEKFVKRALELGQVIAPVMSFPAISVPAIKAVSQIYSAWEERAAFIMGSPMKYVVASQQAAADPDRESEYMHILSGDYVLVPKAHVEDLKSNIQDLEVRQGYLLKKNADQNEPADVRKDRVLPGISYAIIKMSVNPVTAPPNSGGSSKEGGDESGGDKSGGDKSGGKSDSKSKKDSDSHGASSKPK